MLRTVLLGAYYLLAIIVLGLIGIPWTLMSGRIDWLYRNALRVAFAGVRMIGIRVIVEGLDRFDSTGTYIYMCNHVSNLDPPIVIPLLPKRTAVLVKKELFRIPLLGHAMLLAQFVPVDRRNREAAIASVQQAVEVLKSGVNITVFPEGTRSFDGKLLPFKKGPFHLAMESGTPVLPMTIHGTETLMPKRSFRIKSGTVHLVFHAPVDPRAFSDREALTQAVRTTIESALPPSMK